jgi:DNA-binding transcriptional regulator YhcF (GntR family)
MKRKIEIDITGKFPVYRQLIQNIEKLISDCEYLPGDLLPSMNELAIELDISKETVQKAYTNLKIKGVIEASHGKGFFVSANTNKATKVLVLFDRLSTYKQVVFNALFDNLGSNSEIAIRLHNQDIELFEYFIEENLKRYHFFIIAANFPLKLEIQKRVVKVLRKIPNHQLILIDRQVQELPGNYGAAYQDFGNDAYDGLKQGTEIFKNYLKLNILAMPGSLYSSLMLPAIKRFCIENEIIHVVQNNIDIDKIQKQETYLILNSQLDKELIGLVKAAKSKGYKIGEDIGIISYNESPVNEIILDGLTVISTDFRQMGELAAQMINDKIMKKVRCDFRLIRRSTF